MPITFWTFLIATLALSGVPPLSGFWSKDAILASALTFGFEHPKHMVIFVVMLLSAAITGFYMLRAVYMTFSGVPRDKEKFDHAHESPWTMTVPLIVLAVLSIGPVWWGWLDHLLAKPSLAAYAAAGGHAVVEHAQSHDAHSAHTIALWLSIAAAGSGILLASIIYYWKKISAEAWGKRLRPVYNLLWNKYYFDELYGATFIAGTLLLARISSIFDTKVIDGIVNGAAKVTTRIAFMDGWFDLHIVDGMVNLVARIVEFCGEQLRGVQTGKVQNYILMALGAVILLFIIQQI